MDGIPQVSFRYYANKRKFSRRSKPMSRCANAYLNRRIAGLLLGLLFAIFTLPLVAQPADSHVAGGYDKNHEITLNGTIQEAKTVHETGVPAGLHVLVNGPQGTVDAHLGPYMSKETQEALKNGIPVQILGAMQTIHGKEYFEARQVTFGGRQVTVRNEAGFFKEGQAKGVHHAGAFRSKAKDENKGGAR
jgi:hypothetical protein